MSKASPKRPMTEEEILAASLLRGVTFPVASWDKRFAATLQHVAATDRMIGEKMVPQLWRLLYRYRRQWKHPNCRKIMLMAEERMAPDYHRQKQAAREQARIDKLKGALEAARKDVAAAEAARNPPGKTLCEVFAEEAAKAETPTLNHVAD